MFIGMFGAALVYGDCALTPAISVLSALEGLHVIAPELDRFVLPGTVAILATLFAVQQRDGRIVLVPLPGHTPGTIGALIELDRSGRFLLASDALSIRENLDREIIPRNTWNADLCARSFNEIKTLEASGFKIICSHDAAQWEQLRKGRVGLAPTGKRRLVTAHTQSRHHVLFEGNASRLKSSMEVRNYVGTQWLRRLIVFVLSCNSGQEGCQSIIQAMMALPEMPVNVCCKSRKSNNSKNLAKVDLWSSLLLRRYSTPLRRSVIDFG